MMLLHITLLVFAGFVASYIARLLANQLPRRLQRTWILESCELLSIPSDKWLAMGSVNKGRSLQCERCHHPLGYKSTIPLLGNFWPRRCPNCQRVALPLIYLVADIFLCFTPYLCEHYYGISIKATLLLFLTVILVVLFIIDYLHQLLPDQLTLLLLWVGLCTSTIHIFVSPNQAIFGAVFGYLFFYLLSKVFYLITKREGMGYGDFKLLAALGAWVGWMMVPVLIVLASVLSLLTAIYFVVTKQALNKMFPFGPYLAISGWITFLYGDTLNHWYLNMVGFMT